MDRKRQPVFYSKKIAYLIPLIWYFGYYSMFLILGEESYITIFDNLTGDFKDLKILADSDYTFSLNSKASIDQVMNGVPRASFRSGINFTVLTFKLFSPFSAFIINHAVAHLIGYLGAYLLLRDYVFNKNNYLLISCCALIYSLFHIYPVDGLSSSGLAIILYAFLNILNRRQRWYDWLLIALFPFFNYFMNNGPFLITLLLLIGIVYSFRKRFFSWPYFLGITVFTILYLLIEFPLISSFFYETDFISHRTEFDFSLFMPNNNKDFLRLSVKTSYNVFMDGLGHAGRVNGKFLILPFLLLLIVYRKRFNLLKKEFFLLSIILALCIFYGFHNWMRELIYPHFSIAYHFSFYKFINLVSIFWILFYALCINKLWLNFSDTTWGRISVFVLIAIAFVSTVGKDGELTNNSKKMVGMNISQPSYRQFYDVNLFNEINKFINLPKHSYRILNVGIYPAVAQFNGFYTLDSYQNNYPLKFKDEFRHVISKELDKNEFLKNDFDGWGNHCYSFSSELNELCKSACGKEYSRERYIAIQDLDFDLKSAKEMGAKYIFSAVPINNSGLKFLKQFSNDYSFWEIFLYEIK